MPSETAALRLVLDDAELTAATALLIGSAAEGEVGEVVEVGKVRLQARGLIGKPADEPVQMDHALVALVGTLLRAQDSLALGARRRSGGAGVQEVSLSFHRLGEMTVEHVAAPSSSDDEEEHSLTALPDPSDVVTRVMQLLVGPATSSDEPESELATMPLEQLERVRQAVASGNDAALETFSPELARAFRAADIFGQVIRVRDGQPEASLTVLSRPGEIWSFLHARPELSEVEVRRVSPDALRHQLHVLWSGDTAR